MTDDRHPLTATVFEALPVDIDDNLTVGLTAATVMHFTRTVIH